MGEKDGTFDRRSFLEWAGAVGLTATAPQTVAAVAGDNGEGPPDDLPVEPPADDRDGDVQVTHPTEYERVRDRLTRASKRGAPSEKYGARLEDELAKGDRDEYNLHVRTVGEPTTIETSRYGRQIDGWSPTEVEVERLSQYGEITYVPEFLSTKISLFDVDANEVSEVAALPFVLSVEFKPEVATGDSDSDGIESVLVDGHDDWDSDAIEHFDPETARDVLGFEDVDDADAIDPDSDVKIGVIDSGYNLDQSHGWGETYAAEYIDADLADQFEEWVDFDYYIWDTTDSDHGTRVTNTIAYMLGDLAEDMIVPIPAVLPNGYTGFESQEEAAEAIRAGISFATLHDIDVLNMSLGTNGENSQHCLSTYCDELEGYVAAGNIAVAAAGNNDPEWDSEEGTYIYEEYEASDPAASRYTVGVGGIHEAECDDGYWRIVRSSYSDPTRYHDDELCEPCHDTGVDEQFVPDVYGIWAIEGPDVESDILGTSNAAPEFTAAAALLKEHGLDDYWEAKEIARNQNRTSVCPDEQSKAGQVIHANDMLGDVDPYWTEDATVDWVTTHAAKISWEPPHSPGSTDLEEYTATDSDDASARTWTTDAPATEMILDDLTPGRYGVYTIRLSATDERGNTTDDTVVGFQTLSADQLIADINPATTELTTGETARFDAVDETDSGNNIQSLEWYFDDGTTATGWYAEHTYDEPGTYWVKLVATNDADEARLAAVEVTVS